MYHMYLSQAILFRNSTRVYNSVVIGPINLFKTCIKMYFVPVGKALAWQHIQDLHQHIIYSV